MAKQIIIKGTAVVAANEVLVADSNSKIPAVDGSLVTAMSGTNVGSGTIATARLDTGTAANKIVVLDGSAKIPAVDGSLLTGIVSYTKSASDPTVSTNPSGGVGTEWVNHTSGKQFICTDATAGANVWSCSGSHSGDIIPWGRPWGGSAYGYRAGGYAAGHGWPNNNTDTIDKYSFTSDANATDVGNLTWATDGNACHSSATYGYAASGDHPVTTNINKWSFASDGNAVAYSGTLTGGGWAVSGQYSETYGYCSGRNNSGPFFDTIDKFNFASEGNATDVGNLTVGRSYAAGCSSTTYGHECGGSGSSNVIDRWSFATDGNATDVGDLTVGRGAIGGGAQSATHGYVVGGNAVGPLLNIIEKFQFVATANSTDVGDLTSYWTGDSAASSSETHGYTCGGGGGSSYKDEIHKYSTVSDANSSDVANLTQSIYYMNGCQY